MSAKGTSILEALTASMKSGPPQRLEDSFYEPRQQQFFRSQQNDWQAVPVPQHSVPAETEPPIDPRRICLMSWNIDILVPWAEERMSAALRYLDGLTSSIPAERPIVIFLQEMGISDIAQMKQSSWVQKRFHITEIDETNWLSPHYGTTALIDRRLIINQIFRVPWVSNFQRDGLFIDIAMSNTQADGDTDQVLRLCNTHLESLVADPPVRPRQLQAASTYLHRPEVVCALLAGDLNAIQPFDRTSHSDNNLKDIYLELGGQEDNDEGYTWGQQAPQWMREKFGCSRMDKIFFSGALQPRDFDRIGMGITVAEEHMGPYKEAGEEGWVTDHYGVMGNFEITGGWSLDCRGTSDELQGAKLL